MAVACMAFWLVSALFLGIGAIAANGSAEESEAGFVGRIGDERAAAALAGYVVAPDLVEVARRHAEEMRPVRELPVADGGDGVDESLQSRPFVERAEQDAPALD